tara:strand:+ start:385 stop:2202 length:1818 start_codon:yes stop_codon:yes gene_type:complete
MEKFKNLFIELATYTTPKIVERANKRWVEYGENNDYFQYLTDRYYGSTTNNAIINGVVEMIYGEGLKATDADKKPLEWVEALRLLGNDKGEGLLRKVALDYKLYGQFALNVIWSNDRTKIAEIKHIPVQTIRSGVADAEGEVTEFWYSADWQDTRKGKYRPISYPAFSMEDRTIPSQIAYFKPYRANAFYYSPVDYQGALQWANIEEEVANYHVNNIQQGFSPTMMVNFNNGQPAEEERRIIHRDIKEKLTGTTNAGKFLLSFNDDSSTATTIEALPLSDADKQYEFISTESTRKIMVGHRLTSGKLVGIKEDSGLGNNAEEIKTASQFFDNTVIRPYQHFIIQSLNSLLAVNGISLDLYFKTLQPIEFTDTETIIDVDEIEKETGVQMSEMVTLEAPTDTEILEHIQEVAQDAWEIEKDYQLLEESDIDDEDRNGALTSDDLTRHYKMKVNESAITPKGIDEGSYYDTQLFKVRYVYRGGQIIDTSREFCRVMMAKFYKSIFRREDISKMKFGRANADFGYYDLFAWKGSYNCRHLWRRQLWVLKKATKRIQIGDTIYERGDWLPNIPENYKRTKGEGLGAGVMPPPLRPDEIVAIERNPKVVR